MYLFLKQANPFLLRLQIVLALTKCRAELLSIWCLAFIWVTSRESCRVSPWRKETESSIICDSLPHSEIDWSLELCFRWPSKQFRQCGSPVGSFHLPSSCLITVYFFSSGDNYSVTSTKFYKQDSSFITTTKCFCDFGLFAQTFGDSDSWKKKKMDKTKFVCEIIWRTR